MTWKAPIRLRSFSKKPRSDATGWGLSFVADSCSLPFDTTGNLGGQVPERELELDGCNRTVTQDNKEQIIELNNQERLYQRKPRG